MIVVSTGAENYCLCNGFALEVLQEKTDREVDNKSRGQVYSQFVKVEKPLGLKNTLRYSLAMQDKPPSICFC